MRPLEAIAARHELALVEDAAQAHLATRDGRPVGTIGVAGAISFYPTKNLGALGDGGAVVTRDAQLAARLKRLRNGGQTSRYHHEERGVNSAARRDAGGDPARAAAVTCRRGRRGAARSPARYRAARWQRARVHACRASSTPGTSITCSRC